jgi:G:T/U-mismatch repair DNA glycosylase
LKKRQRVFVKTRRHISIIMQSSFLPVEEHPLEPFLPANAKLLMLGSFPPQKKRWSMDFFYPNLQNDMWRIFGLIFFDDKDRFLSPEKKAFDKERLIEFLTEKGIALYDTASSVRRLQDNASDKFLEVVEPTDIRLLLKQLPQCKAIVTTGQKATDIIRSQIDVEEPKVGESCPFEFEDRTLRLYRMPSSSRAYPLAIEKKASVYRFMLNELVFLR